jgi:perosamine synthetase
LTTGPKVKEFEADVAAKVGAKYAVAVSNGTAALHCAAYAAGVEPGDEVIVASMTFAASSNAILYLGATVVFADVNAESMLIDLEDVKRKITPKTKCIVAVDMCGQPCDYEELNAIGKEHNIKVIADSSHSLGATYKGKNVGTLTDLSTLSFHPVKNITTGEGGMVTTDDEELYKRALMFRQHGITRDHKERTEMGSHYYEMQCLGFNYRLTDIQCALGINQLKKLEDFISRRQAISARYHNAFTGEEGLVPVIECPDRTNAHHIFVIRLKLDNLTKTRDEVFAALQKEGIGVNVHYLPVHMHPHYRKLGFVEGSLPVVEAMYNEIITLPVHPSMTDSDADDVIAAVKKVTQAYLK